MAALTRSKEATYEVHENVTVDTYDNEDHTFCGIMFPVTCKSELPLDHLLINSVSVRGKLGPLTVWMSNDPVPAPGPGYSSRNGNVPMITKFRLHPKCWTKVYQRTHAPSVRRYQKLKLDIPIRLQPGETKAIYVHSTLHSDKAIVYDNTPYYYREGKARFEDEKITIHTGRAHVSPEAFSNDTIWGWGGAWRDHREFVGSIDYGVIYQLWHPQLQPRFPDTFQDSSRLLFMCQRRWESPFSMLPDECIFYILHMCRWDWFKYDPTNRMKWRRKKRDKRTLVAITASSSSEEATTTTASSSSTTTSCPRSSASGNAGSGSRRAVNQRASSSPRWKCVLRQINVFSRRRDSSS